MTPGQRRLIYAVGYEAGGVAISTVGLAAFFDAGHAAAGALAVATSVVAFGWNLAFNAGFERWESRQVKRGRSIARRVAHAVLFEAGLAILLIPLIAVWLDVSLFEALVADVGLTVFFAVYTFVYNWIFDTLLGLPESAR